MLELVTHRRLEVCGDDRPLVNAGAEKLVALVALDVEIELGPLDLGQSRRHDDGASRSGRRDMPHVDFITDCRVAFGQQAFQGPMARDFHETDHRRGGKCPLAANMVGEQVAVHHAFEASFQAGPNPFDRVQEIDCLG